jgi:hypothetical protein
VLDGFFKKQNMFTLALAAAPYPLSLQGAIPDGILSIVKNLLCACHSQIPRHSGLEYQSYYFALLKKPSNTCPLKLLLHRGGAKLESNVLNRHGG